MSETRGRGETDPNTRTDNQQSVLIVHSYEKINERLKNEIRTFTDNGYDVDVVIWQRGNLGQSQRTEEEMTQFDIDYLEYQAPFGSWKLLFYLPLFYLQLARYLYRHDADTYHCSHLALLPITCLVAKLTGRNVVYDAFEYHAVSFHGNLPSNVQEYVSVRHIEAVENLFVRLSDGVVTVDSANDQIISRYRARNPNSDVLFNAINLQDVPDVDMSPDIADTYVDRPLVVFVGGIKRIKGIIESLHAADIVQSRHSDVLFLFIGTFTDDSDQQARDIIDQRGLEDNVEFKEWMTYEKMLQYLIASDVGLAPFKPVRKFEMLGKGCNRKQFTYMSAAVPVVGTEFLAVSDHIEDIPCGITTDTTDPEMFAEAIIELLDDPEYASDLGKRGHDAILTEYNWETEQEKLLGVYDNL